jgi:hypothetical protein
MKRTFVLAYTCLAFGPALRADPVKAEKPDAKALAKDCATAWVKAVSAGHGEAVVKLMATPFRGPERRNSNRSTASTRPSAARCPRASKRKSRT